MLTIMDFAIIGALSSLAAIAAVLLLSPRGEPSGPLVRLAEREPVDPVWLFDGTRVVDATDSGWACPGRTDGTDWDRFRATQGARFPGIPEAPEAIGPSGMLTLSPGDPDDPARLTLERIDGVLRAQICGDDGPRAGAQAAAEAETLRLAVERAPYPIWRLTEDGAVSWHNPAYGRLAETHGPAQDQGGDGTGACAAPGAGPSAGPSAGPGGEAGSTTRPLFPLLSGDREKDTSRRMSLTCAEAEGKHWFDVSVVTGDEGALCYAIDIDTVVEAENAQRMFVQTLAKTFAQLSTGLAIFDRNRQLALFNPALIDLTSLPADFLSGRPNLLTFFDRLRDLRMMPEPKNYNSWRHQMADLVAAASDGRYQETWSLPSGSVYSVSGRPHPDGAIAFLIEDITAEITLTRRFRSDLELGQAILNQLDEAIAVFSSDGTLALTNAAYRRLWKVDPDSTFAKTTVVESTRAWQQKSRATPVWGEIRDFVTARENRSDWSGIIRLTSGEPLSCQVSPVQNGATMVSFSRLHQPEQAEDETDQRQAMGRS